MRSWSQEGVTVMPVSAGRLDLPDAEADLANRPFVDRLDRGDVGPGWPPATPGFHGLHAGRVTFQDGLNPTIGAVADPAGHAVPAGLAPAGFAEPDSLYHPVYDQVARIRRRTSHGRKIQPRPGSRRPGRPCGVG